MNKFLSICISSLLCFDINLASQNTSFDIKIDSPKAIKRVYIEDEDFDQYYCMTDIDNILELEDHSLQLISEDPLLIWSNYYYDDILNMFNSAYVDGKSLENVLLNLFYRTSISNCTFNATTQINKLAKRLQKKKNRKRFSKIITILDNVLELEKFQLASEEQDSNITITISKEDVYYGYTMQFDV